MRATRMTPEARVRIARTAAMARWTRERFGHSSFAAMGLPGGDLVDVGRSDLVAGKESVESLMVSLAAPRLRREGVPVPKIHEPNAESKLYRTPERETHDLAHARYLAYLRQMTSFADACVVRRASKSREGGRFVSIEM